MSSKRSFSESGLPEWLRNDKGNEKQVKSIFTFSNKEDSLRKNVKEFVKRCKSNPERSWRKQRECERILIPATENEDALNRQAITDQPRKLSYFSYLGNAASRFGRYHSISTNTDVVITLGHDTFLDNNPQRSTNPEAIEMQRGIGASFGKDMTTAQQYLDCLTCMCCVKALFYHGTKDFELERDWSHEPCACEGPGKECLVRWSILGILTTFMPCLLCYPVFKSC